ncbi:MAG: TRAM domain-containing protein [Chloroflexota bacterium]
MNGSEITLTLTDMAHGGLALGRDLDGRPVFVPYAIPGETVRVRTGQSGKRSARAELLQVTKPSSDRVQPPCPHFGICGSCHLQHMTYEAQIAAKQAVVVDQLERVGKVKRPSVAPIVPAPEPYGYLREAVLFPAKDGGLGYWSPKERRIIPVSECPILHPVLQEALAYLDVDLPELRKLTLRLGDEDELLAALEVDEMEPPELAVDFPVSVAIVLPDRTAAALIGDPYLITTVNGRPYRVSPGVVYPAYPAAAESLTTAVLALADLQSDDTVLQIPGDAGWLTAALAGQAADVVVIEPNPDAVADMVVNLDEFDTVAIYEGFEEEVLPDLDLAPDVVIFQPANGLTEGMWYGLSRMQPRTLVIIGEIGAVARDMVGLGELGYRLVEARPVDFRPQGYEVLVAVGMTTK